LSSSSGVDGLLGHTGRKGKDVAPGRGTDLVVADAHGPVTSPPKIALIAKSLTKRIWIPVEIVLGTTP
jgi:hypothetical protein